MKEIPLTRGYVALVDDEDYERINSLKWCATVRKRKDGTVLVYAHRGFRVGGKCITEAMHRAIIGIGAPEVDHWDGNGLNNQRANLRPATRSQNAANLFKRPGLSSRFKGVSWFKPYEKYGYAWRARLKKDQKEIHIGYFREEVDAALAYNFVAFEHFGEHARFNTPEMAL